MPSSTDKARRFEDSNAVPIRKPQVPSLRPHFTPNIPQLTSSQLTRGGPQPTNTLRNGLTQASYGPRSNSATPKSYQSLEHRGLRNTVNGGSNAPSFFTARGQDSNNYVASNTGKRRKIEIDQNSQSSHVSISSSVDDMPADCVEFDQAREAEQKQHEALSAARMDYHDPSPLGSSEISRDLNRRMGHHSSPIKGDRRLGDRDRQRSRSPVSGQNGLFSALGRRERESMRIERARILSQGVAKHSARNGDVPENTKVLQSKQTESPYLSGSPAHERRPSNMSNGLSAQSSKSFDRQASPERLASAFTDSKGRSRGAIQPLDDSSPDELAGPQPIKTRNSAQLSRPGTKRSLSRSTSPTKRSAPSPDGLEASNIKPTSFLKRQPLKTKRKGDFENDDDDFVGTRERTSIRNGERQRPSWPIHAVNVPGRAAITETPKFGLVYEVTNDRYIFMDEGKQRSFEPYSSEIDPKKVIECTWEISGGARVRLKHSKVVGITDNILEFEFPSPKPMSEFLDHLNGHLINVTFKSAAR